MGERLNSSLRMGRGLMGHELLSGHGKVETPVSGGRLGFG